MSKLNETFSILRQGRGQGTQTENKRETTDEQMRNEQNNENFKIEILEYGTKCKRDRNRVKEEIDYLVRFECEKSGSALNLIVCRYIFS